MEVIKAKEYDETNGVLVLKTMEDMQRVYTLAMDNTDFILSFNKKSVLMIADNILASIKNGELKLGADEC